MSKFIMTYAATVLFVSGLVFGEVKPVVVCSDAGAGEYEAFPDVCMTKTGDLLVSFMTYDAKRISEFGRTSWQPHTFCLLH